MYERLIFATELERAATRQLIRGIFPLAVCIDVPDNIAEDFLLDVNIEVEKCIFFRWASATQGPSCLILYSCYNMSIELFDPPPWMIVEIRRLLST